MGIIPGGIRPQDYVFATRTEKTDPSENIIYVHVCDACVIFNKHEGSFFAPETSSFSKYILIECQKLLKNIREQ